MPILAVHTYTRQYTPIQIQTNTCNTDEYMQYKQIQCNTYQYIIHANTCKYISIHINTYHTYQYMHLYSIPNTNQIHTQYIPSMYRVCIERSIQTLEFNTRKYIPGKPLMGSICKSTAETEIPWRHCWYALQQRLHTKQTNTTKHSTRKTIDFQHIDKLSALHIVHFAPRILSSYIVQQIEVIFLDPVRPMIHSIRLHRYYKICLSITLLLLDFDGHCLASGSLMLV